MTLLDGCCYSEHPIAVVDYERVVAASAVRGKIVGEDDTDDKMKFSMSWE